MTAAAKEKPVHPPSANRLDKEKLIAELGSEIKDAPLIVVTQQFGLDADETLDLRRKLRAAGVGLKIGKNTLIKHAIKGVAAAMGDQMLDAAQTKTLASLPSLDELRGKFIGLLLAPATKIAGVLQ